MKIIDNKEESLTGDVLGAFIGGFIGGVIMGPIGAVLGYTIANGISEAMPEVVSEITSRLFPRMRLLKVKSEELDEFVVEWKRLIRYVFTGAIMELKEMYEQEFGGTIGWFEYVLSEDVFNEEALEPERVWDLLKGLHERGVDIDFIFQFLPDPKNDNVKSFLRENFPRVLAKKVNEIVRAEYIEVGGVKTPVKGLSPRSCCRLFEIF